MNTKSNTYQIFISYRRNGSDAHARVFYEKLTEAGYSVFLDFESLFSGGFKHNIFQAIEGCTDFLLLIPHDGLERCNDEEDLMREEIKTALTLGKNIIPIFINGFKMPSRKELPQDIADLAEENGIECSMEYFNAVFAKVLRNLSAQPVDKYLYATLDRLHKRMLSLEHEYFKNWACFKLDEFLSVNDEFFDGTNWTNPHAEDTFGISGIQFTQKTLKAITAVSDYWKDNFAIDYLKKQAQLIARGVSITRIFILEKGGFEAAKAQMSYQKQMGIDVYYIEKDNEYIDPDWLKEDYLIQDDELLVQIYCETHQFVEQDENCEQITMDTVKVKRQIERFQRILERSLPFTD